MIHQELSLAHLAPGEAEVVRLDLQATAAQRLKALGIFAGQRIQLAKTGNPMIVRAAGGSVAVAHEVAAGIVVRAAGTDA